MPSINADLRACQGYGNCAVSAPDIFGVDDSGLVVVRSPEVLDDDIARVSTAVRSCPVSALQINLS
jgi:ferredoxin